MEATNRRSGIVGPAAGVGAGLALAFVAVVLSRLFDVASPTVLAVVVGLGWLVAVGGIVARTIGLSRDRSGRPEATTAVQPRDDDRPRTPSAPVSSPSAGTAKDHHESGTQVGEHPSEGDAPAWLDSDETPWLGTEREETADSDSDDGDDRF